MDRDIKEKILKEALQNQYLRSIIFYADYNNFDKKYIELLDGYKQTEKNSDIKQLENKAMVQFILQDESRYDFIIDVIKVYLFIKIDINEPITLEGFSKEIQQTFLLEHQEERRLAVKEQKGDDIRNRIKNSKQCESDKRQLSTKEQELMDILNANQYDILYKEIANELGVGESRVSQIISHIEQKGYNIKEKMNNIRQENKKEKEKEKTEEQRKQAKKNELTEEQREFLEAIEEIDECNSIYELAKKLGKAYSSVYVMVERIENKGYDISEKVKNHIPHWIKKFCRNGLEKDDAIKVAKFIKYKRKLQMIERQLQISKEISYNNISILIDELLQDEKEDKTEAIEFVIEYEKILLEKDIKRVGDPLYQLLIKYGVQLTKVQGECVSEIMDMYERKLKEKQNDNIDNIIEQNEEDQEI